MERIAFPTVGLCAALIASAALAASEWPMEAVKIRPGGDPRTEALFRIEGPRIYRGDRSIEENLIYNVNNGKVREKRERRGAYLFLIRGDKLLDADDRVIYIVSAGKLYDPKNRREPLFNVSNGKLRYGNDHRSDPLYSGSSLEWDDQTLAMLFAILIQLDLIDV